MTERRPEDIRKAIDGELSSVGRDPFLYQRVMNLSQEQPRTRRCSRKLTVALAVLIVLMLSTAVAVATNWMSVRFFLTQRLALPVDVQDEYVAYPALQSFDSERINLTVLDAYWYDDYFGDKLALTMHVDTKEPELAFCKDTDIGTDGESFDMIWWHGDIIPVEQWLAGREGYVLDIEGIARSNGERYLGGIDHIQEERGLTVLLELRDVPDLSEGATLTMEVGSMPIAPSPGSYGGYMIDRDDREDVTLTVTLPPMTRGPAREIDWANEPNA